MIELIERLVALIPRPEKNLLVYHGVLAPNAKWRARVTSYARAPRLASSKPCPSKSPESPHASSKPRPNADWARLMQRAFDIDVLDCPRCGDRMTRFAIPEGVRLLALIQHPNNARRLLRHLGERDHAPPIAPAIDTTFDFDDVA